MTIQNGRRWLRLGRKRRRCGFAHQQHDEISGGKRNEETDCFAWYHLEFHEKENPSGYIEIQKEDENGNDLAGAVFTAVNQSTAGWHFEVKDANGTLVGNYVTDDTGVIAVELVPGTYTVTETDGEVAYWVNDPNPTRTVTVEAHETAVVTFINQWRGKAKIIKTLANPEAGTVEGWSFEVQDSTGAVIGTYVTDENGEILVDLEPGQYTVTELLEDGSPWQSNPASQTIIVQAGQTAEVTFINALKPGEIRVLKTDREDNPLPGAEFRLKYSEDGGQTWKSVWANAETYPQVGGCTSEGLVDGKMVTGSDGMAVFALPMTGSNGFALLQNIQTVCLLLCATSLWLFRKKR